MKTSENLNGKYIARYTYNHFVQQILYDVFILQENYYKLHLCTMAKGRGLQTLCILDSGIFSIENDVIIFQNDSGKTRQHRFSGTTKSISIGRKLYKCVDENAEFSM